MIVKSLHFLRKPSFEALTVTRHGTYLVQPQAPGLAVDINCTCEASSEHAITRHEPYSASGPGPV